MRLSTKSIYSSSHCWIFQRGRKGASIGRFTIQIRIKISDLFKNECRLKIGARDPQEIPPVFARLHSKWQHFRSFNFNGLVAKNPVSLTDFEGCHGTPSVVAHWSLAATRRVHFLILFKWRRSLKFEIGTTNQTLFCRCLITRFYSDTWSVGSRQGKNSVLDKNTPS